MLTYIINANDVTTHRTDKFHIHIVEIRPCIICEMLSINMTKREVPTYTNAHTNRREMGIITENSL